MVCAYIGEFGNTKCEKYTFKEESILELSQTLYQPSLLKVRSTYKISFI